MTPQLYTWEYEGKTEFGYKYEARFLTLMDPYLSKCRNEVTNLRPAKVVDADVATKTYLTTEQFITVWNSLDDEKRKELHAAWEAARNAAWEATRYAVWYAARYAALDAARNAARYANLAVLVKDKISDEHFEILTKPWTSCGLSLFAEDWQDVLNPKVLEPKGFGVTLYTMTCPNCGEGGLGADKNKLKKELENHIATCKQKKGK